MLDDKCDRYVRPVFLETVHTDCNNNNSPFDLQTLQLSPHLDPSVRSIGVFKEADVQSFIMYAQNGPAAWLLVLCCIWTNTMTRYKLICLIR